MKKILFLFGALFSFYAATGQAWIQRTNYPAVGRHRATGIAIGNKGYIGLGHVNGTNVNIIYKDWWEYDPSSDSWTQRADYPVNAGNYGAIAFATATRGYVGGGATLNNEFHEYNPQTNTWNAIANCPASPTDQGSFVVNNKGYVLLGNLLWEYDPVTDTWTSKQNAPVTFGTWCTGFSIGSSGYIKSGPWLYEYKPGTNQWLPRAAFPGAASNAQSAFVRNGKGYIVTGYVGSLANVTSQVWEYNPGNNTWAQLNDFLGSSRRFSVAFAINNRGYFGTGTNGINFNDFWEMTDAVAVNELPENNFVVNVFPNPAEEDVQFTLTDNNTAATFATAEIRLYNAAGELLRNQPMENNSCKLMRHELPSGIYFYQLLLDGKTAKSGKIIFR